MTDSRQIAGLIGPALIAMTISEALNVHIWAANIAPVIYLNGSLLFIGGFAIVRAHNRWSLNWSVIVTLTGWFMMLLGLLRMFFPEFQLRVVQNTSAVLLVGQAIFVCTIGIYLTYKSYSSRSLLT